MAHQRTVQIILSTWSSLLFLYGINRLVLKQKLVRSTHIVRVEAGLTPRPAPGTWFSKVSTLWVFIANIATFFLVFLRDRKPGLRLAWQQARLPGWVNVSGALLFVTAYLWGFLALVFNPNYTPLTNQHSHDFVLATRGPYAVMRHPRYAAEAFLNIVLFVFTGIWLPLLGLLGWPGLVSQARAEERYLENLAGEAYNAYGQSAGMFLPKRLEESFSGLFSKIIP